MAVFIVVIVVGIFIFTSPMFEKEPPVVTLKGNNGYWNMVKPLELEITDESGVTDYTVTLRGGDKNMELKSETLASPQEALSLKIDAPKNLYGFKADEVVITVEAKDASKWNFWSGNDVSKDFMLVVDRQKPFASVVTRSWGIRKGGSALVVFKASDANLDEFYVDTNFDKRFKAQPFYKEGYYAALIAWPVTRDSFQATLTVTDKAGNVMREYINFGHKRSPNYRQRTLNLTPGYLEGKIAQLAEDYPETQGVEGRIAQFKVINEDVRAANEKRIHEITSNVSDSMITTFSVRPMYPLKNGKVLGGFGDHRTYVHEGQKVSEAYHLGLDMASVKHADIVPQNGGEVVFAEYNGIYGNMPIIDHGMGLYTLFAHCSTMNVHAGDTVKAGTTIARTGTTGSVLGDHLHFGVLVQGVDVRPQEWMDANWIKINVTDVLSDAKQIIDRH
jgi:murein DD-endopeptidase MepM/ murein hydrolase activator NlpD